MPSVLVVLAPVIDLPWQSMVLLLAPVARFIPFPLPMVVMVRPVRLTLFVPLLVATAWVPLDVMVSLNATRPEALFLLPRTA